MSVQQFKIWEHNESLPVNQPMLDQRGAKSVHIYIGLIQSGEPQIVPVLAQRRYQVMEFVWRSEHVCEKRLCLCSPYVPQAGQLGKIQCLTVGLIRVGDAQRCPLDGFQLAPLLDCQSSVPYLACVLEDRAHQGRVHFHDVLWLYPSPFQHP